MFRFTADVEGLTVFDRAFNRLSSSIADFRGAVWGAAAHWFFGLESRLFQSGGASGFHPWPALERKYEERRAKKYTPFPLPLIRTGDLNLALTRKGVKGNVYDEQPLVFTVGAGGPIGRYGNFHMKPYKKRPAREPIQVTERDRVELQKTLQREFVTIVRRIGFEGESGIAML